MEKAYSNNRIMMIYPLGDLEKQTWLNENVIHPLQNMYEGIRFEIGKEVSGESRDKFLGVSMSRNMLEDVSSFLFEEDKRYFPKIVLEN